MKISEYIKIIYDDDDLSSSVDHYPHLKDGEIFEWIYWNREDYRSTMGRYFVPIIDLEKECINDFHFLKDITLLRFEDLYLEIYNEIYNMGLHKDKYLNHGDPDIEIAFEEFKRIFDLYKSGEPMDHIATYVDPEHKSKNLKLLVIKVIYRYYIDLITNNDNIVNIQDNEIYFKDDIDLLGIDLTYKLYPIPYITFFGKGSFLELRQHHIISRSILPKNEDKWKRWFKDKIRMDKIENIF